MIDLIATDDQAAIAEGVADFLRDSFPIDRFRRGLAKQDRWSDLAELGAFGVSVPECAGGIGLSLLEDVLVFREFGRHLISPAAIATRIAACIAANGATDLAAELVSGKRRAGLVTDLDGGVHLIGAGPDDLLVRIHNGQAEVYSLEAVGERSERASLDGTLELSHGKLVGKPEMTSRDPKLVLSASLLASAMLCGLLEVARDMAAEYAKTREQFGRPIGVFQGVKHPCAEIATAAEEAWSHTAYAALMLHAGTDDAAFHVTAAKLTAGENALDACRANIQIHAGMGFTDEVDAHLLLKRSHVLHQALSDPRTVPHTLLTLHNKP